MQIGVLVLWLAACGSGGRPGEGDDVAVEDPVTVVEIGTASLGDVAELLTSSAVVESEASANLVPEASGIVRRVLKDEGDAVKRGDVLAVLDNVTLGTGAERANAEVVRLREQVTESRGLLDRGAISVRELEDLQFQLEQAERQAREATRTYGSTRLAAPFDGVVAERMVTVGELATSASPAFLVVDPDQLRVVTSVPERDLGRVAVDQPARLVSAYDDAIGTTGKVLRIAPVVDASSGTFRVTIGVDDPTKLRPGQFVTVQIVVDQREDVLVIPKAALLYQEGRPVVFTLGPLPEPEEADPESPRASKGGGWFSFGGDDEPEKDEDDEVKLAPPSNLAVRRPVELGLVDEVSVQITSGLANDESIITLGHTHLRDGAKVRVVEPAKATEAAPEDAGSAG
ncbi:MAG: efflux RND transporter periplasmic adaptor subunit [Myxococcota bacterium]